MKNINQADEKHQDFMELKFNGVEIRLSFAENEESGIRERIIDILSDEYEKRRLGEKTGEKLREN